MSQQVWIDQPCPLQMERTYYYADGSYLTKKGGTVSWRNNNEGNLRPGSLSENRIGKDNKNFAVFATPEDGRAAKKYLLFSSKSYKTLTLTNAIKKYAPSSDSNDPTSYVNYIKKNGNVADQVMCTYTSDEQTRIMDAMKKQEGYQVGTVTQGKGSSASQATSQTSASKTQTSSTTANFDQAAAVTYNKGKYSKTAWQGIQKALNAVLKTSLTTDGNPGKLTANAIYTYQAQNQLGADGKCGAKTFEMLAASNEVYAQTKAVAYNKEKYGKTVWVNIQGALNTSLNLSLTADGNPGKLTANAVYLFQAQNQLDADGKCGAKTLNALGVKA